MKTILCYGDSNTHGSKPDGSGRFDRHTRWPGVLRDQLGDAYEIIEEGLGGRTTVWDDPIEGYKNGKEYLIPCLESHKPIDLVAIMLGTNDLKTRFSLSAYDIARGAAVLVYTAKASAAGPDNRPPQVLLIAPPPVLERTNTYEFLLGGYDKSKKFAEYYAAIAKECGCHFLDAGSVIVSSPTDGVHFDAPEHAKLGHAVAAKVRAILG